MIPKVIHYCWFGGNPLPELAIKCIESWKKYCPDYEIIEWNENNFNIELNDYVKEAYQAKKWAFVSDVARLYALVNYGGIYMDTDVEVVKSLDSLLGYEAVSGFEAEKLFPTGLMACEKGQRLFVELLREYDKLHFIKSDGSFDLTTNVTRIMNSCIKYGFKADNSLQTYNGFTLLPQDYLCPKDYSTGEIHSTENTLAIHHFNGSWVNEEDKYQLNLEKKFRKLIFAHKLAKIIATLKYRGITGLVKDTKQWIKKVIAP